MRPTADRVREAVFNILTHAAAAVELEGAAVVDVFSGTGAMGLEALSRGAARVTFIDTDAAALKVTLRNAAGLGEAHSVTCLRLDAARLPAPPRVAGTPCAAAFLDPPYGSGLALAALAGLRRHGWIGPGAIAVVEIAAREPLEAPPGFEVVDERIYGAARVVFLRALP